METLKKIIRKLREKGCLSFSILSLKKRVKIAELLLREREFSNLIAEDYRKILIGVWEGYLRAGSRQEKRRAKMITESCLSWLAPEIDKLLNEHESHKQEEKFQCPVE